MNITVTKHPQPILKAGLYQVKPWTHDGLWAYHPCVVKHKSTYMMYYTGKRIGKGVAHTTLLATSQDMNNWYKHDQQVLPDGQGGSWDSDFTAHAYVWKEKGKFMMLYDGSPVETWLEEIGLAASGNGNVWEKNPRNPVFHVGSKSWEKRHVSRCCIYKKSGTYHLYYAGHDGTRERICLAKGSDVADIRYRRVEPVLDVGAAGDWDEKSISDPRVIEVSGKYIMFYSGMDAYGYERTGAAISTDLAVWKKYRGNPVLDVSPGKWDAKSASRAFPFVEKNIITLFYSGRKTFFYSIGRADVSIS